MVTPNFIRDAELTTLITDDGPVAFKSGSGQFGELSTQLGGGLALGYDGETGQLYAGRSGVTTGAMQALVYEYDNSTLGGAIGEIELDGPKTPANFRIYGGFLEVLTSCAGASGTLSVGSKTGSTTDLLGVTAVATLTAGYKVNLIPDFATIGDSIKNTTACQPIVNIATTAFSAGRLKVVLFGQIIS